MESRKNNQSVERRLKESLKHDRARIQIGSISHFGLMEMSRQRLRPSLTEASLITCPHCAGMGHIRSPESAALHILRAIEDEGGKFRAAEISVTLPPEIAFYLFNHKRERLSVIEARYAMRVLFVPDAAMTGTNFRIERLKAQTAPLPVPAPVRPERELAAPVAPEPVDEDEADESPEAEAPASETAEEKAERVERGKRRRRRRGKRRDERPGEAAEGGEGDASSDEQPALPLIGEDQPTEIDLLLEAVLGDQTDEPGPVLLEEPADLGLPEEPTEAAPKRRRTRGGRRRRGAAEGEADAQPEAQPEMPVFETPVFAPPVFTDIADIFEAAEQLEAETRARKRAAKAAAEAPAPEAPAPQAVAEPEIAEAPQAPVAEAQPTPAPVEPAPEAPVSAKPEPAVKPILIGAEGADPGAKKSGWWRR